MTLNNPFGIDRYLHPRRSGMIVYKGGGGPAPEVDGGISDEQYNNLMDRVGSPGMFGYGDSPPPQNVMDGEKKSGPVYYGQDFNRLFNGDQIGGGGYQIGGGGMIPGFDLPRPAVEPVAPTGLYAETDAIGKNLNSGFAGVNTGIEGINTGIEGVNTGIAGVNTGVNTGFADLTSLLDQYNTDQNTQFAGVNTAMADNAANINTGLNTLQTGQDTGFNNVGTRFDAVDTAGAALQTTADQGFQDQTNALTAATANINTGFADAASARDTGFSDASTALQTGFEAAGDDRDVNQQNVLAGQQNLNASLDVMGDTADAYATQSLQNQAALQSDQDGFVSNFDDYVNRYSDDTRLAQDTRSDMQTANARANESIRNDMGAQSNAAEGQRRDMASNITQMQITQARDTARAASTMAGLDNNLRQEFSQLGTSFDDQGNLIQQSVDQNGVTTRRALDAQGNMILNTFDTQGRQLGQQQISLGNALANLQQIEMPRINNPRINSLTPAASQRGGGLYANTRS